MKSLYIFDNMITRYDKFFKNEFAQSNKRMNTLVSGRQIHDVIKQVIEFYDTKEK